MILIGQFDSPFVRRVAVALNVYGLAYDHQPWSTFGDAEKIARYNPLSRVPTFVLDDGEVLIESAAILDYLDGLVAPSVALIPAQGKERRDILKICALASGLCDKMVSLVYERVLRDTSSEVWVSRCKTQIGGVLEALEMDRGSRRTPFWFGDRLSHADVAVTCAVRFLKEAHPSVFSLGKWPHLVEQARRCEDMDVFKTVVQTFSAPGD